MKKFKDIHYKIKHTKPNKFGIYEKAKKLFGVNFEDGIIFTIGNKIYCKEDLPDHLIVHESTHIQQQREMGVEKWWNQYFACAEFRFIQEAIAYKRQYRYFNENCEDKGKVLLLLKHCAKCLSGSMYGNLCSFKKACEVIKDK